MIIGFIFLTLKGQVLFFVLIAFLFVILTLIFYKYTIPPIVFWKKILLSSFRSIVLLLLLFMLFEPVLSIVREIIEKPKVAVLLDNTQSILVSKNSLIERTKLKKFFDSKDLENKNSHLDFNYYSFSNQIKKYENFSFDSLNFTGQLTDISLAIQKLKNENYSSVILITDGNYNTGKNPIYDVEENNIPFYVVGIGDTAYQKDLMITKVQTNNIAYANSKVPIEVTLRWYGFKEEIAELILTDGNDIITRSTIKLSEIENERRISLSYDANKIGTRKLSVKVSEMEGELTEKNNYKNFYIEVLKSKLKIMILAGAPSPDVSMVYNTLKENQNYDVLSFVQRNSKEFYPFFQNGKNEIKFSENFLDTIDCIVFINYPTAVTELILINKISKRINDRKIPLLFIMGKDVDFNKLQDITAILPFNWANYNSKEILVFPSIAEKSAVGIIVNEQIPKETYQQLPPLIKQATQFRSKIESEVIAYAKDQYSVINEPLFVLRNINRQKSFGILSYGLWRWKLLTQGTRVDEFFLNNLFSGIINWLTILDDKKKVRVIPVKQNFTVAEPVEFVAEVYNEQYRPVDKAYIQVSVVSGVNNYDLVLNSIGNGRYEGSIRGINSGDYTYSAKAMLEGVSIGEDKGVFSVGTLNIEYLDTRMNTYLLNKIALQSNGKFLTVDSIQKIPELLSSMKAEKTEQKVASDYKIWNLEIVGVLIMVLLFAEWFIRKQSGLL